MFSCRGRGMATKMTGNPVWCETHLVAPLITGFHTSTHQPRARSVITKCVPLLHSSFWRGWLCVQRVGESSFCPSSAATLTTLSYLQNCHGFPSFAPLLLHFMYTQVNSLLQVDKTSWLKKCDDVMSLFSKPSLVGADWKCAIQKKSDCNKYLWDIRHTQYWPNKVAETLPNSLSVLCQYFQEWWMEGWSHKLSGILVPHGRI